MGGRGAVCEVLLDGLQQLSGRGVERDVSRFCDFVRDAVGDQHADGGTVFDVLFVFRRGRGQWGVLGVQRVLDIIYDGGVLNSLVPKVEVVAGGVEGREFAVKMGGAVIWGVGVSGVLHGSGRCRVC